VALIIEGAVLVALGVFLFLIGNETIKMKSSEAEQIIKFAPLGGIAAFIVGSVFVVRGLLA
jgi:branched-subunit amino acid transport protein